MKKQVHLRILMEIQAAYFEILAQSCSFASNNKKEQLEICRSTKPNSLSAQAAVLRFSVTRVDRAVSSRS